MSYNSQTDGLTLPKVSQYVAAVCAAIACGFLAAVWIEYHGNSNDTGLQGCRGLNTTAFSSTRSAIHEGIMNLFATSPSNPNRIFSIPITGLTASIFAGIAAGVQVMDVTRFFRVTVSEDMASTMTGTSLIIATIFAFQASQVTSPAVESYFRGACGMTTKYIGDEDIDPGYSVESATVLSTVFLVVGLGLFHMGVYARLRRTDDENNRKGINVWDGENGPLSVYEMKVLRTPEPNNTAVTKKMGYRRTVKLYGEDASGQGVSSEEEYAPGGGGGNNRRRTMGTRVQYDDRGNNNRWNRNLNSDASPSGGPRRTLYQPHPYR